MAGSTVRQRRSQGEDEDAPPHKASPARAAADDAPSPWLDGLRVLSFLVLASFGLSYVVSGGDSWAWGLGRAPGLLRPAWWKAQLRWPVYMTLDELAAYDGSDPARPIYLAVNGTIYDVSKGRHMYGPGTSYHALAGHDAARAFVTTCVQEDNNPDLRGVEQMFLPLDDPDVDAHWSVADMTRLRADELAVARERAYLALKNWVDFFAHSPKYHRVGYVKIDKDWLAKQPVKELCDKAQRGRTKRQVPR